MRRTLLLAAFSPLPLFAGDRVTGSGMTPCDLNFCLQDRGELFTLEERQVNTYAPGSRPFHTIIPAFIARNGATLNRVSAGRLTCGRACRHWGRTPAEGR